jgi:hypothetical protein
MKRRSPLLLALASLGMGGCAMPAGTAEPSPRSVTLDGKAYIFRQITESTWTASAAGSQEILEGTPTATAALQKAVELVSGCSVTDSDYSRQGTQFDAQVNCAGSLGH